MTTIEITEADRQAAEDFLVQFLKEQLPNVDLSKGASLRDLLVTGLSLVTAEFRQEATNTLKRQSIRRVIELPDGEDKDDAVDEILSNLYITRNTGKKSRGTVTIHFSQATSITIKPTDRFNRTTTAAFAPDITSNVAYDASELGIVRDSNNVITEYTLRLSVVATETGIANDIDAGVFLTHSLTNPFITQVTNDAAFTGGKSVESTSELLLRAPTALTLRDLVTDRASDTVIREKFTSISKVAVIGMGDPEMQRDKVTTLQSSLNIHAGGYTDLYVSSNLVTQSVYTASVGGTFTDPRVPVTIFRDAAVADFTTIGGVVLKAITPRMVLQIYNALTNEPTLYIVDEVNPKYLRVSLISPFPAVRTSVEYSIGEVSATYVDAIAQRTTGEFSKTMERAGEILLPVDPVYRISDVSTLDSGNLLTGDDGRVHYTNRKNVAPSAAEADLEYQVVSANKLETPSAYQVLQLKIPALADGTALQVTYDTVEEFSALHTYVTDKLNRVTCANYLAKAFHPVYLESNIQYTLRTTAQSDIDTAAAKTAVVNYINNFPSGEVLNISDVISYFQASFPDVGSVLPVYLSKAAVAWAGLTPLVVGGIIRPNSITGHYFKVATAGTTGASEPTWNLNASATTSDGTVVYVKVLNYTMGFKLYAPDGRVIPYVSQDQIVVKSDHLENASVDADSLDTPTTETTGDLGISDRTIRYLTTTDLITITNI